MKCNIAKGEVGSDDIARFGSTKQFLKIFVMSLIAKERKSNVDIIALVILDL